MAAATLMARRALVHSLAWYAVLSTVLLVLLLAARPPVPAIGDEPPLRQVCTDVGLSTTAAATAVACPLGGPLPQRSLSGPGAP